MSRTARTASTGSEQARQQLPAILNAAERGRTTVITRRGRKVAAVVPVSAIKPVRPASLLALAGSGKGLWGRNSTATLSGLRDEWNH